METCGLIQIQTSAMESWPSISLTFGKYYKVSGIDIL